jgi:hypothetical protein
MPDGSCSSGTNPTACAYDLDCEGGICPALFENPNFSAWKAKILRHPPFAVATSTTPFQTSLGFGTEHSQQLQRSGDLMYWMYLKVILPGITAESGEVTDTPGMFTHIPNSELGCVGPTQPSVEDLRPFLPPSWDQMGAEQQEGFMQPAIDAWAQYNYGAAPALSCCNDVDADCPDNVCPELDGQWAHWVNAIGQFLIDSATIRIGGQVVDTLWGDFMFIWEELTGKAGRRLTEMTGRRYTRSQLICDSREERVLYVPLPFWFTQNTGQTLILAALAYHSVSLYMHVNKLEKLINVSRNDIVIRKASNGHFINACDLRLFLETAYIYLSQQEREKFTQTIHENVIRQTQKHSHMENMKKSVSIRLGFSHPTIELIWFVRLEVNKRTNNWTNFGGIDGRDPIECAELTLNSSSRFGSKPALYWRGVVPFQSHSNIPDCFIYVMTFALNPEETTMPTGACNLSRIDDVHLKIEMQESLRKHTYEIVIFSRSYNIFRYEGGVGGCVYA